MTPRESARTKSNQNSNDGKLINEIDSIGRALYLDKSPSQSSSSLARSKSKSADKINVSNSKAKHGSDDLSTKDKKSFWNWKPLKALSQVRHRRFNCCFTLDVHTIEGLPLEFNNLSLCVHWKRRDGEVVTSPIKVVSGLAEFEEKLTHTCSVYGSRSGPHHSAKYEAKHFLLYAAVSGNPKFDLGKHRVDLTRLLPLTLEELEAEKCSGTWTTTFKLLGEAKGAVLNVSFGYLVLGDSIAPNNKNVPKILGSKSTSRGLLKSKQGDGIASLSRAGSLPTYQKPSMTSRSVDDIKTLHEVPSTRLSEFSDSVNILFQKFDEENSDSLVDVKHEIAVPGHNAAALKQSVCPPSDPSEENILNEYEDSQLSFSHNRLGSLEEKEELDEDKEKIVTAEDIKSSELKSIPGGDENSFLEKADLLEDQVVKSPEPSGVHGSDGNSFQEEADFVGGEAVKSFELNSVPGGDGNSFLEEADLLGDEVVKSHEPSGVHGSDRNALQQEPDILGDEVVIHECKSEEQDVCFKDSLLEDLESALNHVAELEKEGLDTPESRSESSDNENQNVDEPNAIIPSHSIDDLADSVADEFLCMLEMEESPIAFSSGVEPESPRERLLREFQREAEASGCSLFGFDIDDDGAADYDYDAPTISGWEEFSDDPVGSLPVDQLEYPKIRAKVVEDLETQALMEEWGLDEKAFQSSPPRYIGGFGSPIDLPPKEPLQLPPLGEGLGPCIQTKTGGFLRTMNPVLFKNAKSGGSLVMQVSSPVVVPAELGSGVMDILQHLASAGLEKLSIQASKLMPLEDMTGKTMQQIAWEVAPQLESSKRQIPLQSEKDTGHNTSGNKREKGASSTRKSKKFCSNSVADEVNSEYVSLEDLAPLAMDKIEALSVEGLRIQSGMSDEEEPSTITAQYAGESSVIEGKRLGSTGSMGLDGAAGLKLLALEDSGTDGIDGDGLMGLSLTLDEWMRLDSGEIDEGEELSERTSKLLAAHHANLTDWNILRGKKGKGSGRSFGLLSNNFTVALMVQLRDPLRDYEPVGTPMLALIQVERIFVPPKPKIYCRVAEARDSSEGEDDIEPVAKEKTKAKAKEEKTQEQDLIPQYQISEVHLAGMKNEPGKKKLWGNAAQQQSGSRWLLANGMGKGNKNPFVKPKVGVKSVLPATITSQPGDTLWSISARYHGSGTKWKELSALNPHIRNPNVTLVNETIKLRSR